MGNLWLVFQGESNSRDSEGCEGISMVKVVASGLPARRICKNRFWDKSWLFLSSACRSNEEQTADLDFGLGEVHRSVSGGGICDKEARARTLDNDL